MSSAPARSSAGGPSACAQAAALVGLVGLAITQPVLDLFGRHPEFFVAGRYTNSQIVEFGVVVAAVPALVLVAAFALARLAHRRTGQVVHGVLLAVLGAVFGNVLLRGVGLDGIWVAVAGLALGALATTLLARARAGHLLLQYLAVANVFFLVGFLVVSPTSRLLGDAGGFEQLGSVSVPEPPGPVVVIVFDELPISTLMHTDGTINEQRYPSFARLAAGSTWFRNASSVHSRTERAAPALLTGTVLDRRTMPSHRDLPRNLLSLLSTAVPVERYEAVTDMCLPDACEDRPGQPLGQAIEDSLVVFGHRVLPPAQRADLPPIDDAWGGFADDLGDGQTDQDEGEDPFSEDDPLARFRAFEASERDPTTQVARLVEQGLAIDASPALHFVHVVLPHAPWYITPWATRIMEPIPPWMDEDPDPANRTWSALTRYQRHSLQTGAADLALGEVLDHLQEAGLWDDATILVTADHGTSTIPPDLGRNPTEANEDEVYRVPLFLKAAGQQEAEVVDDAAMTIDVLPTLIDLLDIETDWEMDGHSLLDGSPRTADLFVSRDVERLFAVVARHASDFPLGWDWTALAAVGDHSRLVGLPLDRLVAGPPSELRWAPDNEEAFDSLPDEQGAVPQVVTGAIRVPGDAKPPALVIVANGTVSGVTGGYRQRENGEWVFTSVLGPDLVRGDNEIDAYEVTTVEGRPVLHLVG